MFLNYPALDNLLVSTMQKYGLRSEGSTLTEVDPEMLLMISEAFEAIFGNIIRELIDISRS